MTERKLSCSILVPYNPLSFDSSVHHFHISYSCMVTTPILSLPLSLSPSLSLSLSLSLRSSP